MLRELFGKDFDGDFAPEFGVLGLVDLSHSTRTDGGEDLVGTELGSGLQGHRLAFGSRHKPNKEEILVGQGRGVQGKSARSSFYAVIVQ